jgi:hypothetical protein
VSPTTSWSNLAALVDQLRNASASENDWTMVAKIMEQWVAESNVGAKDILGDLERLPWTTREGMADRTRETATHYAWCLISDPGDRFSIWINEYKSDTARVADYARSIHNHRYDFVSTMLNGSYVQELFDVRWRHDSMAASVTPFDRRVVQRGDTLLITADLFHRISNIAADTLTLLIKSEPRRLWSTSVDPATMRARRHVPAEARLGDFMEHLRRIG